MSEQERKEQIRQELKVLISQNSIILFNLGEIARTDHGSLYRFINVTLGQYDLEKAEKVLRNIKEYLNI